MKLFILSALACYLALYLILRGRFFSPYELTNFIDFNKCYMVYIFNKLQKGGLFYLTKSGDKLQYPQYFSTLEDERFCCITLDVLLMPVILPQKIIQASCELILGQRFSDWWKK